LTLVAFPQAAIAIVDATYADFAAARLAPSVACGDSSPQRAKRAFINSAPMARGRGSKSGGARFTQFAYSRTAPVQEEYAGRPADEFMKEIKGGPTKPRRDRAPFGSARSSDADSVSATDDQTID
jgi:hypothetical protein